MHILKTANNKQVLRITYAEWVKIGRLFTNSGRIPMIRMDRWHRFLRSKGFEKDPSRGHGSHEVWPHTVDPHRKAEFSSHNDTEIFPIIYKVSLKKAGISLTEFLLWHDKNYGTRYRSNKKEEESDVPNLPQFIENAKWRAFIKWNDFHFLKKQGDREIWNSYDSSGQVVKEIAWSPVNNKVDISQIKSLLNKIDITFDTFWDWYQNQQN